MIIEKIRIGHIDGNIVPPRSGGNGADGRKARFRDPVDADIRIRRDGEIAVVQRKIPRGDGAAVRVLHLRKRPVRKGEAVEDEGILHQHVVLKTPRHLHVLLRRLVSGVPVPAGDPHLVVFGQNRHTLVIIDVHQFFQFAVFFIRRGEKGARGCVRLRIRIRRRKRNGRRRRNHQKNQ